MLDRLLAALALLALSPVMALVAVILKLGSPGPLFYLAQRCGQHGQRLTVPKFRSMHHRGNVPGPSFTLPQDPRVYPFGRLMRALKLDELPQLWLVVTGRMTLIGPRPEEWTTVQGYSNWMKQVLEVKPGLSSEGSIYDYCFGESHLEGKNHQEVYDKELMPILLAFELDYEHHRRWGSDSKLVWKTLATLFQVATGRRHFPAPPQTARVASLLDRHCPGAAMALRLRHGLVAQSFDSIAYDK